MANSLGYILFCLVAGIAVIVLLTTKYRLPAFFALLIAGCLVGTCLGMPVGELISTLKTGFGNIIGTIGLLIILGTTLGLLLEYTGCTHVMAEWILRKTGDRLAPAAMSIIGLVVGLPIFCDAGFIVLSGLNRSVAKRTRAGVAVMAGSLATGLYAVHCLVPPHPGVSAAAGVLSADIGKLVLFGILVAVPAAVAGYCWVRFAGKDCMTENDLVDEFALNDVRPLPATTLAFLPVFVPVALIALRSVLSISSKPPGILQKILITAGDPVAALSIGILLAFAAGRSWKRAAVAGILQDAVEKAAGILVIIGAGGAFGAVLSAAKMGEHLSAALPLASMGLVFPFLLTFILKTAQGSSTVAIITAASIIQPLLPVLGLTHAHDPILCVLAMGAGSMMISHANDAYFWVVAKFSGLSMNTMLRVYTMGTVCMGVVAFLVVEIVSKVLG